MASHADQSTDHRRLLLLLIVLLVVGPLLWLSGMAFLTTFVVAVGPRPPPNDHRGVVDETPHRHRRGVHDAGAGATPDTGRRRDVHDAGVVEAVPDARHVARDAGARATPDARRVVRDAGVVEPTPDARRVVRDAGVVEPAPDARRGERDASVPDARSPDAGITRRPSPRS